MPFRIKKPRKFHVGTTAIPKYEVFDVYGDTTFTISSATYVLYRRDNREVMLSGSCTVNNADTDRHGNTIRTIAPTLDFTNTDIDSNVNHWLIFDVTFSSGQTDVFGALVRTVEWDE